MFYPTDSQNKVLNNVEIIPRLACRLHHAGCLGTTDELPKRSLAWRWEGHFYPAVHRRIPRAEFTLLWWWVSLQRHTPISSWKCHHLVPWVKKNNVLNTVLNATQGYRSLNGNLVCELYQEPHKCHKVNKSRRCLCSNKPQTKELTTGDNTLGLSWVLSLFTLCKCRYQSSLC